MNEFIPNYLKLIKINKVHYDRDVIEFLCSIGDGAELDARIMDSILTISSDKAPLCSVIDCFYPNSNECTELFDFSRSCSLLKRYESITRLFRHFSSVNNLLLISYIKSHK